MDTTLPSTFLALLFTLQLLSEIQGMEMESNKTLKNNSESLNITGLTNRTLSSGIKFSCKWNYDFKIAQTGISAVVCLSGLFILSVGYRKRRISFFIIGFVGAGILTYLVCLVESKLSTTILILVSIAGGLFVSLFTTTVLYIGYFVAGLFAGLALGFGALLIFTTFKLFYSIAIPCVAIASVSLVQVFFTLWWRRVMLIASTSILGATMFAGGLDYFVEGLFLLKYAEEKIFYSRIAPMCWHSYVVIGVWPASAIAGMLIQLLWTGKEKHKTNYVLIYRRKRHRDHDDRIGLTSRGLNGP